jgi:catechol 2,3-dioxygenase-like lactoylglutathione lyase family enzyme
VPLARWKDLCIDANDAWMLGRFWADLLGRDFESQDNGDAVIRGERPEDTIWVNRVPEPKTVKHRVHLDVRARSLAPILDLGAAVVLPAEESGFGWTIMADPEGGEFCVFLREEQPEAPLATLYEMGVDTATSATSERIAAWWAEVLGARLADDGRGFWWIEDVPHLPFETIDFAPVPEPKTVKNRIHWDVVCDDVDALVARGATVLRAPDDEVRWHVMADPDGNEFCAFASA